MSRKIKSYKTTLTQPMIVNIVATGKRPVEELHTPTVQRGVWLIFAFAFTGFTVNITMSDYFMIRQNTGYLIWVSTDETWLNQ